MLSRRVCLFLASLLVLLLSRNALAAAPVWVDEAPTGPLGQDLSLLIDASGKLTLDQVRARVGSGFVAGERSVPAFGIGADPVWFRLVVDNPTADSVLRVLLAGTSWIDQLDFYVIHEGQLVTHQTAGDREAHYQRPVAGMGYLFRHQFAPGQSEVYLRASTPDPLLLPLRMLTPEALEKAERQSFYSYGMVYGFVLALLAYNLMLYFGIGQQSHLNYSLYLSCFLLMNVAYTGHGYVLFWSEWQGLQRYIILAFMAMFACAGFRFAINFLGLKEYAPRVARLIRLFCVSMLSLLAAFIALGMQQAAAFLAFSYALSFAIAMVVLGWDAVRRGRAAGSYFLAAACSGMAGVAITTITVWGWIPFTQAGYRAVEIGVLVEATLLALAVAYRVREHESARHAAEYLARIDPLTGLLNRRALAEQGERLRAAAQRHRRPLALVIFDLDHFKFINDLHGHAVGDQVLKETANLLQMLCRRDDLAARWGGEEFIVVLPDADIMAARNLAERLREQLQQRKLWAGDVQIELRASFGVAVLRDQESIDALIAEADVLLYRAKQSGRNRICSDDDRLPGGAAEVC
ncbi:MAG: GGDEF domain-containing protein [Alcanivoracaceae bacterium]|nr:GGDEF domain-containing protein [Alcanivoracaceae bacterium]